MIELMDDYDDYFMESGWVIPHHSPLDYCYVQVIGEAKDGRYIVKGRRDEGWIADNALITCKIARDKLTSVPSSQRDFLELYDDPCQPILQDL